MAHEKMRADTAANCENPALTLEPIEVVLFRYPTIATRLLKFSLMFATILAFSPFVATAQEESQEPRCWFYSKSFSPGASIRTGEAVWTCSPESSWQPTDGDAKSSGCFAEDKFYSTGGIYEVGKSAIILVCAPDGSWQTATQK